MGCSHKTTLPGPKKVTLISLDSLQLRLWHTFLAALFQRVSKISQDLYTSSAALKFHQDLASIMVNSDHCAKPSPVHPKDSHGVRIWTPDANPCVNIMSHAHRFFYVFVHSLIELAYSKKTMQGFIGLREEKKQTLME